MRPRAELVSPYRYSAIDGRVTQLAAYYGALGTALREANTIFEILRNFSGPPPI